MKDLESMLSEIVAGQRFAADVREADADACVFRGDMEGAIRLRRAAAYLRSKADAAVEELARTYRARVESPEYVEQTDMIARLVAADREALREHAAERASMQEERIASRRAAAAQVAT